MAQKDKKDQKDKNILSGNISYDQSNAGQEITVFCIISSSTNLNMKCIIASVGFTLCPSFLVTCY